MSQPDDLEGLGGFTVAEFCARFKISRQLFYKELAAKKLKARKIGNRTIVLFEDARVWAEALPEAA